MALEGRDKAAASNVLYPACIKLEIRADDGTWCDVNKAFPSCAADPYCLRLKSLPDVEYGTETRPGRFGSKPTKIILDDHNAVFAGDGWTLYDSDGATHVLTAWYHALIKISVGHHVDSPDAWDYQQLCVLRIESLERQKTGEIAIITAWGREKQLQEKKAKLLRRGDAPPINMPVKRAVEELIEIGGEGDISFESGSPPDDMTMTTDETALGIIGNIPCTDEDGNWNEKNNFIPRCRMSVGSHLWQFGLSRTNNCPACCWWDRDNNVWYGPFEFDLVAEFPDHGANGYQLISAFRGIELYANYIFAFAVSNICFEDAPSSDHYENGNLRTYLLRIPVNCKDEKDIVAVTGWWDGRLDYGPVWSCNHVAQRSERRWMGSSYQDFYGRHDQANTAPHNVPMFFQGMWSAPNYDDGDAEDVKIYHNPANAATGALEPFRMTDLLSNPGDFDDETIHWTTPMQPGYYSHTRGPLEEDDPRVAFYWRTHGDLHEAFKLVPTLDSVFWIAWDGGDTEADGHWTLCSIHIGTLVTNETTIVFNWPGMPDPDDQFFTFQITAFGLLDREPYTIWLAIVNTYDLTWTGSNPGPQIISGSHYELATVTMSSRLEWYPASLRRSEKDNRYGPVFISIRVRDTAPAPTILGVVVDWFSAGSTCYGIWWWHTGNPGRNGIFQRHLGAPGTADNDGPLPISSSPLCISNPTSGWGYYILDQGNGSLWYGVPSTGFVPVGDGQPVDGDNTWESANLFVDDADDYAGRLYGSSVSGPPADTQLRLRHANGSTQGEKQWGSNEPKLNLFAPAGRISLWSYSQVLPATIPVADFGNDATIWQALEQCRFFVGDYIMGFNGDVEFYFKPRPTGDAELTIKGGDVFAKRDGTEIHAQTLKSKYDHESVVNKFAIQLYEPERATPETTLLLQPDSKGQHLLVTAMQSGSAAQRVVLRCIQGASLYTSTEELEARRFTPLLWAWRRIHADIYTTLSAAALATAEAIYVRGLYQAADGTYRLGDVEVREGDELQIGDSNWMGITTVDSDTGMITLEDDIGGSGDHPVGAQVTIRRQDSRDFSDSMDGICSTTSTFTIAGHDDDDRPAPAILYVNDSDPLRSGMVLIYGSAMLEVLEILSDTMVRVQACACGSGSCNAYSNRIPSGAPLRAAIWIQGNGKTYAISNTGISISVSAPNEDIYRNSSFVTNDRIRVTCAGVRNVESATHVFTPGDSASIDRYGEKNYSFEVDNRIITYNRLKAIIANTAHLAWPTRVTTAMSCRLLINQSSVGPCARIDVCDPYLFPSAEDYTVPHIVIGWKARLALDQMDIVLRSVPEDLTEEPDILPPRPAWPSHGFTAIGIGGSP